MSPVFDMPFIYDAFFAALFFCTLSGYIVFHIAMYDDWRHAFGIFSSFMYIAAAGLYFVFRVCLKNKIIKAAGAIICAGLIFSQVFWMVKNHPYQYVYFNELAKGEFADRNFILDYWVVSFKDLIKYALNTDGAQVITLNNSYFDSQIIYFNESQKKRLGYTAYQDADYYLSSTCYDYEPRFWHPEFVEADSVTVDGMKISAISRREPMRARADEYAAEKIADFKSSSSYGADLMFDGSFETFWQADDEKGSAGYMVFEFNEPVGYDFVGLRYDFYHATHYPQEVKISVSDDGVNFRSLSFDVGADVYFYLNEPGAYRFLKLEGAAMEGWPFVVCEMVFGQKF